MRFGETSVQAVLEVGWGVAQEADACVGCGCCVRVCQCVLLWFRSGLSDLCCPSAGEWRVLVMKYSGYPGHSIHGMAHTFYHPSVIITVASCMCAGDSLRPPLLLLCR